MSEQKDHMVRIKDNDLFIQAKIYSATTGLTLIEITESALKQFFQKKIKKPVD